MIYIGIFTVAALIISVVKAVYSGRLINLGMLLWALPMLGLSYMFGEEVRINGIVIILSVLMMASSMFVLNSCVMWYDIPNKNRKVINIFKYAILFIIGWYYGYECITYGYLDYMGIGLIRKFDTIVSLVMAIVIMMDMNYIIPRVIDRYFSKRENFIIIKCSPIKENGIIKKQGIKGIQNGKTFVLRADKLAYFVLRNEKRLILDVKKGVLGGMYVSGKYLKKFNSRRIKRARRIILKRTFMILLLIVLILLLILRVKLGMGFSNVISAVYNTVFGLK